MFIAHKRVAAEGDFVFLFERKDSIIPVFLKHGEKYQCILGAFLHDDMIGKEFGSIVVALSTFLICRLLLKLEINTCTCYDPLQKCGLCR